MFACVGQVEVAEERAVSRYKWKNIAQLSHSHRGPGGRSAFVLSQEFGRVHHWKPLDPVELSRAESSVELGVGLLGPPLDHWRSRG